LKNYVSGYLYIFLLMKSKIILFITIVIYSILQSQRRNDFADSDKIPNCDIIKKGVFSSNEENGKFLKVKFRNNKMIEIYGKNTVIIKSNIKMLSKCKLEAEIKNIKTKYKMTDSLFHVGKKTEYEIVETGKNSIIYEYWCNEGRNTCSEILGKE
jgi:hypothetical protein